MLSETNNTNLLCCRGCKEKIHNACAPANIPQPNMTVLMRCGGLAKDFEAAVMGCKGKTGAEACACWTNTTLKEMFDEIRNCSYKVT